LAGEHDPLGKSFGEALEVAKRQKCKYANSIRDQSDRGVGEFDRNEPCHGAEPCLGITPNTLGANPTDSPAVAFWASCRLFRELCGVEVFLQFVMDRNFFLFAAFLTEPDE
jgi:hypothetical protein